MNRKFCNTNYLHLDSVDSTNLWVKRNLDKLSSSALTLVSAKAQTAGLGQFKRPWFSSEEGNIYASYHFALPLDYPQLPHLAQVTALSLCQLLKENSLSPKIKWPNDVRINQKKIAGILCEGTEVGNLKHYITGIGVNINMSIDSLESISQPATSFFQETNRKWDEVELLYYFTKKWQSTLELYLSEGFSVFIKEFELFLENKKDLNHCDLNR